MDILTPELVQYGYNVEGQVNLVQTKASASVTGWTVVANGYTYEPFGPVDQSSGDSIHIGGVPGTA